jgi:Ca-activated chloride channel homolog
VISPAASLSSRARTVLVFAVLALPALLWGQTSPPRRPPQFGAGIDVIRLNISVLDGRSQYVTQLDRNDFAVFEDGVRQELNFFTRDPLPLTVSLLIDCSASMDLKLPVAQEAGARFLRTLGSEDTGQVVQFNERVEVLQDFTSDTKALEKAVRSTRASGPTVLYNALYVTLKQLRRAGGPEVPRRRAIILLSDGEDTASLATDDQVMELARTTEVAVYAIGLQPERPLERKRLEYNQATHFLTALARDSGGQAFFPAALSELDAVYGRIAEELRTQYTLGYVSANPHRDGKWRRIVVRTPARDELQVRHKIGYFAPRG